jgi:hypothetical protein
MVYYFLLLNKHKNLSVKRKSDYKRNFIIAVSLAAMLVAVITPSFFMASKKDIENLAVFVFPAIVVIDFSLRFFLKKNAGVAIVPYLTLPIPRKTLILYIILSDLQHFWIWGCWLIYAGILGFCGILAFENTIILLFLILFNNYLIVFVKALIGGYAILTYPLCLGLIIVNLLITYSLNIFFAIIEILAVSALLAAVFFTLKENLYKELNRFAL